jgi:hypothetical protein
MPNALSQFKLLDYRSLYQALPCAKSFLHGNDVVTVVWCKKTTHYSWALVGDDPMPHGLSMPFMMVDQCVPEYPMLHHSPSGLITEACDSWQCV